MAEYRARFPLLERKTYLNSCSYGALADSVEWALLAYLKDRRELGACWGRWVDQLEGLRGKTARLLGADSAEVAIVASLTAGLNTFASCLDFSGARRKVVTTSYDFPTTAQIWHAQKRRGADIALAQLDEAGDPLAIFERLIDEQTLVVSVPWVCYRNGRRLDINAISELAHRRGALVVVDAYQGVGTLPCDVRHIGADLLLGGYLKYLIGTAGVAYLYVRESLIETLNPSASGWFSQADVHAMVIADNFPAPSARRFEGGTPDVAGLYACLAGLELIEEVGIETIRDRIDHLTGRIRDGIGERGWHLASGDSPHGAMLALRCRDMEALVAQLAEEDVVVSCRDDNIRISPHFYNDDGDIERLFAALEKHRGLLD